MKAGTSKLMLVSALFLIMTSILVFPATPASILQNDAVIYGSFTRGDVISLYSLFGTTTGIVLFMWVYLARRKRKSS